MDALIDNYSSFSPSVEQEKKIKYFYDQGMGPVCRLKAVIAFIYISLERSPASSSAII